MSYELLSFWVFVMVTWLQKITNKSFSDHIMVIWALKSSRRAKMSNRFSSKISIAFQITHPIVNSYHRSAAKRREVGVIWAKTVKNGLFSPYNGNLNLKGLLQGENAKNKFCRYFRELLRSVIRFIISITVRRKNNVQWRKME